MEIAKGGFGIIVTFVSKRGGGLVIYGTTPSRIMI